MLKNGSLAWCGEFLGEDAIRGDVGEDVASGRVSGLYCRAMEAGRIEGFEQDGRRPVAYKVW